MRTSVLPAASLALCLASCATAPSPEPTAPTPSPDAAPAARDDADDAAADASREAASAPAVPWAVQEAAALAPLVTAPPARAFLDATARLPAGEPRTLDRAPDGRYVGAAEKSLLSDAARADLTPVEVDADAYYTTRYGSPLAYSRVLQLLGEAGLQDLADRRVLDFGSGTVGHLRLLALAGADVTGVDVDPFLAALYGAPEDTGPVEGGGSVTFVHGRWPADADVLDAVGAGYDVFTSKNTLKNGYIHPAEEVDPRMLVDLGVDDETFVANVARVLRPGGLAILYNLCPPQRPEGEGYIPWADGRSPFTRELLEAHGLEVLAFDVVDDTAARAMARALGWDARGMDPDTQLFAVYTLARKRAVASAGG